MSEDYEMGGLDYDELAAVYAAEAEAESEPDLEPASTELVKRGKGMALIPAASPADYLAKVTEMASALADVINKQRLFTVIGPKKHVNVEGWTTLGALMGVFGYSVFAVPDGEPEWVEIDGVKGVKATMKAVTADGREVGGATSYCMRNESRWRTADFYAMAGMAQTRATSRALRQPLGFIVKLAGFEATPTEEAFEGQDTVIRRTGGESHEDDTAKLLARVRSGMERLEGQAAWSEGAIVSQANALWGREYKSLDDLDRKDLEAVLDAMSKQGVSV